MGLHPSDVLESPAAYVALQVLVGGTKLREWGLEALAAKPGERILDLGCGPAYYVDRLGDVDYIGFDTHAPYIEAAKKRFPRARFYCELFGAKQAEALGPFDAVFLMGLLHHLEDEQVDELLGLAAAHLRPGGRVVALDTVVYPGQSAISRTLAKNDRGDHVRTEQGYTRLAKRHFERVDGRVVGDSLTCPSAGWLMTLTAPRRAV